MKWRWLDEDGVFEDRLPGANILQGWQALLEHSLTRFDKISPLWQDFANLAFFDGFFI